MQVVHFITHPALSISLLRESVKWPRTIICGRYVAYRVEHERGAFYYVSPEFPDMTFKNYQQFVDFVASVHDFETSLSIPNL